MVVVIIVLVEVVVVVLKVVVVKVSMLVRFESIDVMQVTLVVARVMNLAMNVVLKVKSLNVVVVNDVVVLSNMLHVGNVMDHGMLVVRSHVGHLREVRHADLRRGVLFLLMDHWRLSWRSFVCSFRGRFGSSLLRWSCLGVRMDVGLMLIH